MQAALSFAPLASTAADRPGAEPAMRVAAARMLARTRLDWAAPPPDVNTRGVSTRRSARPTLELKASRALDNPPRTGD
jgi:hypothetical protein